MIGPSAIELEAHLPTTQACERACVLEVLHSDRFGGVVERRRQASHPPRSRPELEAAAPNDIWSWDSTRLRGPGKRNFFYL